MSVRAIDWKTGVVSTTGATTVTVCQSDVIPDGSVVTVKYVLNGRETTTGDIASANGEMRFKRVAGILTAVGALVQLTTIALGSDAALLAAVVAVDASGTNIRLRATGVAALTVEWFGSLRIYIN